MICFLTSNPLMPENDALNPANRFVEEQTQRLPQPCRALTVASDPDGYEKSDFYSALTKACFEKAGVRFQQYTVLDHRNSNRAAALVSAADLIILSGGHVPTQNRFFAEIGLKALMEQYAGVVIGISAGSMNSADTVYAQPELEGEATDPTYQRFLSGLGLTKTMLLPHYQEVKDAVLDGRRVFEDITYPDSLGKVFYAIPDGTYLLIAEGREELRGEAYRIRDGVISQIAEDGEIVSLTE